MHKLTSHALAMEEPLCEIGDQMRALCLICDGLFFMQREEEARALCALSWSALRQADTLKSQWDRVVEVA